MIATIPEAHASEDSGVETVGDNVSMRLQPKLYPPGICDFFVKMDKVHSSAMISFIHFFILFIFIYLYFVLRSGQILLLQKEESSVTYGRWVGPEHFQNIIVGTTMMTDHLPDRVFLAVNDFCETQKSA